jgi:hypothetical protein
MNLCTLCQQNEATQKNSHIFPRFFKRNYLKSKKGFFYYNFSGQKVDRKVQDLPKQDYIFCPECESRFQTLEHYASLYLNSSYSSTEKTDFPTMKQRSDCQFALICDPKIFTLFVYSLIWRAHISTDDAFKDFILPKKCETDLRKTIYEVVPTKISELQSRLHLLKNQRWNYIFIKPEKKEGIYHVINYNDNVSANGIAFIHTFEYAIIFVLNRKRLPNNFKYYVNRNFETFRFLMMKTKLWNSTIEIITNQLKEEYKKNSDN